MTSAKNRDASAPLADAQIAPTAALFADPARAAMLLALSDGRALPAGELARAAHVSAPTASAHLTKLTAAGLLSSERHGRHRYYRLANPAAIGAALEALAVVSPAAAAKSPRDAFAASAIRHARTCYDHLAGNLGVGITDALVADGALALKGQLLVPTTKTAERLDKLGVDMDDVAENARQTRRALTRACLDWSERRYHLAGALGAALAERIIELGWVERTRASRAVRVTNTGRRALRREFGLTLV